jgi:hypothetical protein
MPKTIAAFVGQRAELLAQVVLTRRKDVHILALGEKADVGIDLIAHTMTPIPGLQANPYFGVQIKGTAKPLDDKNAANRMANLVVRSTTANAFILAPIILMIFSMEGDQGYWGWVMEPFVDGSNSPTLHRPVRMQMTEISSETLDDLVSRVISWFDAMGKILLRDEEKKK